MSDINDSIVKATYTKYKTIVKEFTLDEIITTYPFIIYYEFKLMFSFR